MSGIGTANVELETLASDVPVVFGTGSPEQAEAASNAKQASADFIGIAVHLRNRRHPVRGLGGRRST